MNGTSTLYVGGAFLQAGSTGANNIASWDGNTWSNLPGSSGDGVSNDNTAYVYGLAMNGTENLLIGGQFTEVGGSTLASNVASWDGTTWSNVGNVAGSVEVVAVNGISFFVGGNFLSVDGVCASLVAELTPLTQTYQQQSAIWTSPENGVGGVINAEVMNGTNMLYVGGQFNDVGGGSTFAQNVAVWNGSSWSALGTTTQNGVSGTGFGVYAVYALSMNGTSNLYVGGSFLGFGSLATNANGIASWDGSSWSLLGNSTSAGVKGGSGTVYALAMNGTSMLYVGGSFANVGGLTANNIAAWNGESWIVLAGNGVSDIVYALAMNAAYNIFVGGLFNNVDGSTLAANHLTSWDGTSWSVVGTNTTFNGVDGTVLALLMNGTNTLYVGGIFSKADGKLINMSSVASWDGNSWNVVGNSTSNGVNGIVSALAVSNNDLFIGGSFTSVANSIPASNLVSWNGNSWDQSGVNIGINGIVRAIVMNGTHGYVGGDFTVTTDGFCSPFLSGFGNLGAHNKQQFLITFLVFSKNIISGLPPPTPAPKSSPSSKTTTQSVTTASSIASLSPNLVANSMVVFGLLAGLALFF